MKSKQRDCFHVGVTSRLHSPTRNSFTWHFPVCIHSENFARVTGMFSLQPSFENPYVAIAVRGLGTVHFVGTFATRHRTSHALWSDNIVPNFASKPRMGDYISSVGFRHPSTLPQLRGAGTCVFRAATRQFGVGEKSR